MNYSELAALQSYCENDMKKLKKNIAVNLCGLICSKIKCF